MGEKTPVQMYLNDRRSRIIMACKRLCENPGEPNVAAAVADELQLLGLPCEARGSLIYILRPRPLRDRDISYRYLFVYDCEIALNGDVFSRTPSAVLDHLERWIDETAAAEDAYVAQLKREHERKEV